MQQELFPREVVSGVPHVTLTGSELVHIEQHRGLMGCQTDEMVFRTASGTLTVRGDGLYLRRYTPEEAMVAGEIHQIQLTPERRR